MFEDELRAAYAEFTGSVRLMDPSIESVLASIRARRRHVVTAGVALIVLVMGGGALAVQAATRTQPAGHDVAVAGAAPTEQLASQLEWQTAISPYKADLLRVASGHDNFSGLALHTADRTIVVYGVGDAPPDVAETIANAPDGAVVEWVSAPYSHSELEAGGAALSANLSGATAVRDRGDYSGIIVSILNLPAPGKERSDLERRARALTDIPVTLQDTKGILPADG